MGTLGFAAEHYLSPDIWLYDSANQTSSRPKLWLRPKINIASDALSWVKEVTTKFIESRKKSS